MTKPYGNLNIGDMCLASWEPDGYVCTLDKGHSGRHKAGIGQGMYIYEWLAKGEEDVQETLDFGEL